MSSYSGEIQYNKHKFHYSFSEETSELEITGQKDKINEWYDGHFDKWVKLENCNFLELVIKLGKEGYSGSREACLYEVDDCFVLSAFKDDSINEIHRITYHSDVLDYFYRPKNRISNIANKLSLRSGRRAVRLPKIKRYFFEIENKEISLFFDETVTCKPYEIKDIDIINTLYVESEESLTYDEVIKINTIVERFLAFVSNSRNPSITYVGINTYPYWEHQNYKYGHYSIGGLSDNQLAGVPIDYEGISSQISSILKLISNDDICFISLFQYEKNKISTVDIMNVCAAFEYQFNKTYPNHKNMRLEQAKTEIINSIMQLIESKKAGNKDVKEYEEIMHSVNFYKDTLLNKLVYAFADFKKFIIKYTANPDLYLVDNYDDIPELIKNARNKLDHGSKKNEVYANELISTITVRIVVYFMILKSAGLRGKKLAKCMNNFSVSRSSSNR